MANADTSSNHRPKWHAHPLTPERCFTSGVEGPSCDASGTFYACNYEREGTIGTVISVGEHSLFCELPAGSVGNGMVFDTAETMYIADYKGHIIFKLDLKTKRASVHIKEPRMNQPNDLAIMKNGILFVQRPQLGG